MADDNIFLNSDPVIDEKLYPREADGILRTTIEDFDLQNWNDTPSDETPKECSCGTCSCGRCTCAEQEDADEEQETEETEFVAP